jgi:hypothetical protein
MCIDKPAIGLLALAIGIGLGVGAPSASAQGYGSPGSLGGFGASLSAAMPGMDDGGPILIPYGGSFEGFMPGRMGGGSALSFRTRSNAPIGARRGAFSLSPLSSGMSGMSGGMVGRRAMAPIGSSGTMGPGGGTGLGGMRGMPGANRSNVMPPSIGYPFRQPPSLVSPSSAGMGPSM